MSSRSSRPPLRVLLLALALALTLGGVLTARSAPSTFVTANNIVLQQGQTLPVFQLSVPSVSVSSTSDLAQRFSGIFAQQQVASESYLGNLRFTVPNTDTTSLLTRYSASGGFYAFNVNELGRETPRGAIDRGQAEQLACLFLVLNDFMDRQGNLLTSPQNPQGVSTPNPQGCDFNPNPQNPLYETSLIRSVTLPAGTPNASGTEQTVGVVVRVPMTLSPSRDRQNGTALPLGGAGGHLSLLFTTTDAEGGAAPSLDSSVPGLAAVAMPFFSRQLGSSREVPIANPTDLRAQVQQRVAASYPGATSINVPQPDLYYNVLDAAVEQRIMEPVLAFEGIEVTVGGETIILRDIDVPLARSGPGGFGPLVNITAPASGTRFTPGAEVTFRGTISEGTAPYSYQWFTGEGESLSAPNALSAAGTVELKTSNLPVLSKAGTPDPVSVVLRVTDNEGVIREAQVSLTPTVAPSLYIPLLAASRGVTPVAAPAGEGVASAEAILAQAGYSFGIEANWDYPPFGPGGSDLPGVIPDATGFRSGMLGYGYSQRFYWTNGSAWERDWRDCGLSGSDCSYGVDRADFVYYAGHGGPAGISMASNKDSTWFTGSNARYQTMRWAGFASCQTLRVQGYSPGSEPIRKWFGAFQGAHMLLGFNSNMADVAFGGRLVDNMRMPSFLGIDFPWAQQTIAQAWVKTAFDMNAGKPAYIYARSTTVNPLNNKLPRPGQPMPPRPLPVSSYHWVWWDF